MAAGGASSSPFGQPPASGGIGSAGRAMFSGVARPRSAGMSFGGIGGRPPMAGGAGGAKSRKKKSAKDTAHYYKKQEEEEQQQQLPTYDKLISLAKRNGLWPASGMRECLFSSLNLILEGKAVLGCLMKYNKNFDKIFEDYQSKIESVDLILTLLVLGKSNFYPVNEV